MFYWWWWREEEEWGMNVNDIILQHKTTHKLKIFKVLKH
jgi:hypothetical protein